MKCETKILLIKKGVCLPKIRIENKNEASFQQRHGESGRYKNEEIYVLKTK